MKSRGFTLIELLVVVAIIGALSSIILASLSSARLRAHDSAIKASTLQLRTVLQQQFSDTGSYAAIKSGGAWKAAGGTCNPASFSGAYASKGAETCNSIMASLPAGTACGANCLYFNATNPNANDRFTILVYLPGASAAAGSAQYLCYGSSGGTSSGRRQVGPALAAMRTLRSKNRPWADAILLSYLRI